MTEILDDPYFTAAQALLLDPTMQLPGPDVDLHDRLWGQASAGDYDPIDVSVVDESAPGPHGPVPVRVYRPERAGDSLAMLVWCHGGSWAFGDLDGPEADATAREVCSRAGAVVISVDYRLAWNGVHYPVPLDDVVAAHRWAVAEARRLGGDPASVTLGGASAGGNLAAGACLRLRDIGELPSSLLLVYPCLHPVLPPPSPELAAKLARLSPLAAAAPQVLTPTVENYLGAPVSEADPYAMPGLADLTGLPPTLVVTCEFDGIRSSGEQFVRDLAAAGVCVEERMARDVLHGHIASPWLPQAQQTYAAMAAWVAAAGSGAELLALNI